MDGFVKYFSRPISNVLSAEQTAGILEKPQHLIFLSYNQEFLSDLIMIFILDKGKEPWTVESEVKNSKKPKLVGMYPRSVQK